MLGNKYVARTLSRLFGDNRTSDCVISFYVGDESVVTEARKRRRLDDGLAVDVDGHGDLPIVGDPLPAHQLVLRSASERFAAQLDRWTSEDRESSETDEANTAPQVASKAVRPDLRIPLGSEEELPSARAALAFAYAGQIQADSISEAVAIWRQGRYLRIKGCAAACLERIRSLVEADGGPSNGAGGSSNGGEAGTQTPLVLQLLAREELQQAYDGVNGDEEKLEATEGEGEDDDGVKEENRVFARLISAAKPLLVTHFCDTLATLNTPSLREQMLALPATGLAALLESNDFGTDNESTVLLLLATWMQKNYGKTDDRARERLCRRVRLVQLSRPYLNAILPGLVEGHMEDPQSQPGWFPIRVREAGFIISYASAVTKERERLKDGNKVWGLEAPTYSLQPRRQCRPATGLSFPWTITQDDLQKELKELVAGKPVEMFATFNTAGSSLAALGFGWRLNIDATHGQTAAGLYLRCSLPQAFMAPGSPLTTGSISAAVPITARVSVNRWQGGSSAGEVTATWTAADMVTVGFGLGYPKGLPLAGSDVDSLAAWSSYLHNGKMTGTVTLLP